MMTQPSIQVTAKLPQPMAVAETLAVEVSSMPCSPWLVALSQTHQAFLSQQHALHQHGLEWQHRLWEAMRLETSLTTQEGAPSLCSGAATKEGIMNCAPTEFAAVTEPPTTAHPGPKFSREDLEVLASGDISSRFGDWFKPLDHYPRLIRMPEPPLLLADRVTGISCEAGKFTAGGTIWTQTDVKSTSWYLHQGRMPAGIMIESGQADLLLASWMGFDFANQGQRIYRLLGCELSYHGELPKPGDTLSYDIHIDGLAKQGDVQLFFFHYDCHINNELRLRVRHGQAGFFTDQELAASGGVLWSPSSAAEANLATPIDPPKKLSSHTTFNAQQLHAFANGDIVGCFGAGFERALTHTRTPCISGKPMLFIDAITDFDVNGGPWQRGYMRATQDISPTDWFFNGHFKNDPCMPGTLMLEAGLQAMACYLTALGYTLDCDGWRFEPVTDQAYTLRCRGQVRPTSQQVVYEIFVWGIIATPTPTLYCDLLGTCDGLKAFHTKIGLRLTPDWPLTTQHPLLLNHQETKPAPTINHFTFDYAALLACAWGKPSAAFGPMYQRFDTHRKVPRLPGPPYHFITRIIEVHAQPAGMQPNSEVIVEYDIPPDAWYFSQNSYPFMPLCVLMEATLQPCGWLASLSGCTLQGENDFLFRNLDGSGTVFSDVLPTDGTLRTEVKLKSISPSAGMIIVSFHVNSYLQERCVYTMDTVFGFFPESAFENQAGLPIPEHEKTTLQDSSDLHIDLLTAPPAYFSGQACLPKSQLLMIDRITGFWPTRGKYGKGQLRAEKTVNPADWFFKAHFFRDPVQPGSLGVEAMLQLLQFYMLHEQMHKSLFNPHFQALRLDTPIHWKYRGQVVPENKCITLLMDIAEVSHDAHSAYVIADASLWVDGIRIYEAKHIGMQLVSG